MMQKQRILVCPLNWGLGHASRCIPLIEQYLADGYEVFLASDGQAGALLKQQFPSLPYFSLPSLNLTYSKGNSQVLAMLKALPSLFCAAYQEHKVIKKLVADNRIDLLISDNRFGLWGTAAKSIYLTHQVSPKLPKSFRFLERIVYALHRRIINQYDELWIPDFEEEKCSLSGDLSHQFSLPAHTVFIGPLSRFYNLEVPNIPVLPTIPFVSPFTVIVLSGLEPHRSIWERVLIKEYSKLDLPCLLVRGIIKAEVKLETKGNLRIVSHLSTEELAVYLFSAKKIICRSGYSSIMDLLALKCNNVDLVPTPGQPEQEYLAHYHLLKNTFQNT